MAMVMTLIDMMTTVMVILMKMEAIDGVVVMETAIAVNLK
jgi:hypothetical protein